MLGFMDAQVSILVMLAIKAHKLLDDQEESN